MWIVCNSVTTDKRFKLAKIIGEYFKRPKVHIKVQERNKNLSSIKFLD